MKFFFFTILRNCTPPRRTSLHFRLPNYQFSSPLLVLPFPSPLAFFSFPQIYWRARAMIHLRSVSFQAPSLSLITSEFSKVTCFGRTCLSLRILLNTLKALSTLTELCTACPQRTQHSIVMNVRFF